MSGQRQDSFFHDFWSDKRHFCDLCNAVLYQGKKLLLPEELEDMDSSSELLLKEETLQRRRDVVKKLCQKTAYVLVGIENQSYVDYGMPLRVMIYDTLSYYKAYEERRRRNRKEGKLKREEYLSSLRKRERIEAVITLVLYYGEKPWEGARRLSDMVQEVPKEAKRWFQDYGMNLIDMKESEKLIFHDQEVELVVSLCRKLLKKEYESIARDSRYKKVSRRLTDVITAFLQDRELKERVKEEKEEVNMCDVVGDCMRLGEKKGERKEKLFIAKNMLKEDFSLSQIQRITGLKLQEIEKLKEDA